MAVPPLDHVVLWSAPAFTVGATLFTVTVTVSVSLPPSWSSTSTPTLTVAGP